MLKICEIHQITYDHHEQLSGCPVCHLSKLVWDNEDEIKELKAEIKELKTQYGANLLEEIRERARKEKDDVQV
jgi:hypothetical protein